ncbi:MAG: VCBS repeat-containing protein [Maribacter sp.]
MRYLFVFFVLSFIVSCTESSQLTFEIVPAALSGLDFNNKVEGNDSLNVMDYDYFYNGGGVGVGDFNLDGKPDLYFTANLQSSRMYLNQGDLTFIDATVQSGTTTSAWCTGVSVIDINQDGKPDIHVATGSDDGKTHKPNYFFINKTKPGGKVIFEDMAQKMGLNDSLYAIQAAWLDYDKDGDLDVFIAHNALESIPKNVPHGQRDDSSGKSTDKLYRNEGLQDGVPFFTDVSREAGITFEGWSLGVQISDFNKDGFPDIYVANDFLSNDILYVNNQDGTFTNDIANRIKHQSHNSMGIDIADIDNDLNPDILVLDMLPEDNLGKKTMFADIGFESFQNTIKKGYQEQYIRNVLQLNNGDGTFSDIGQMTNVYATDWSWSPLIADFDHDGLRDIYITNGYVKEITDLDFVNYYNKSNIFGTKKSKRDKLIQQLNQMKGMKKSNVLFKNIGDYEFQNATDSLGLSYPSFSNGAVYADLDGDGDLELVVNNINDHAFLFKNNTTAYSLTSYEKNNYLQIKLKPDHNALGSRIVVYTKGKATVLEYYPQRGYLSSVDPMLHLGLGANKKVDSLRVEWPDATVSNLKNIEANQVVNLNWWSDKRIEKKPLPQKGNFIYTEMESTALPYVHQESDFNDFTLWPLHFRCYDKLGPAIAIADVNNDRKDDVFLGGSANNNSELWIQSDELNFEKIPGFERKLDRAAETVAATFFDADGDGDMDLYCANGSSEHYNKTELLQDYLYLNDGKGNFSVTEMAIPQVSEITVSPTAWDYDHDGDMDLFVGGRVDVNNYPSSPRSYLFENDGSGKFTDVTETIAPELARFGMISSVAILDIEGDGWEDLVLAGEWMSVTVFRNRNGQLKMDKTGNGLAEHSGWWNCIKTADIDKDGDLDLIAGNWGLNNPFKASEDEPLSIYGKDFDENGTTEAIMAYFNFGQEFIFHPRNTVTRQLPKLKKRIHDYKTFGSTPFSKIFSREEVVNAVHLKTTELSSGVFENLGDGNFKFRPFPKMAQTTPLFDFSILDLNNDGILDIVGVGNFYGTEVLSGRYDAGDGLILLGTGGLNFEVRSSYNTGFKMSGEARKIKSVSGKAGTDSENWLIVPINNDSLKFFRKNKL